MMVIDTVHSSGVGRLHGQTKLMTIVRPLHTLQGSAAKRSIASTSTVEKKGVATINLDGNLDNRPTLVIRRRIMVPQSDEASDGSQFMLFQTPIVLSNQPKSSTTTTGLNPSTTENKTDLTVGRFYVLGRSSASTQDPVCKSTITPMTKPRPKAMHLFDLNKLPTSPDCFSPIASPTSTMASADSTTLVPTDAAPTPAMATDHVTVFASSPNIIKTFTDAEGANLLAVDLGVLPPASPDITRRHNVEDSSSALQEPQYCRGIPTPARKRLRKLSEYAGGHMSSPAHAAPMASKPWTTDGGDVGNHRDVTKTLALPGGEAKVRGKDAVVDDEVLGAVSVLLMMASSTKRRREFSYISSMATERSTSVDLEPGPSSPVGSDLADSETTSSRSWGSGGSVLLRPSNKQRYRSMAELMAQTPILKRV